MPMVPRMKKTAIWLWITLVIIGLLACESLTTLPQPPVTTGSATMQSDTRGLNTPTFTDKPLLAPTFSPIASETPLPSPTAFEVIHFAVIGDYGEGSQGEADVATLVKSWNPDFIITVGDNNYPIGSADTIDQRIGEYYHEFISPYRGDYGLGADTNRFFPTLGNHDWDSFAGHPYLEYFELPGNERYYEFTWGPVYFLALDSDSREPDGVSPVSPQAQWTQTRLAQASAPWKVVYFHHAPYSSGYHGPVEWMRWPFAAWGASVVFSGHDHIYERLMIDGIPYFINGVGGGPIYAILGLSEGSQFRYNEDYGAMLVTVDPLQMTFQFFNRRGEPIDNSRITKNP
jgi:tartrate-resistant acid phosphatase type 5